MKMRDIESLYNAKSTWMHRDWKLLLQMLDLPDKIAEQLSVMHQKLFDNNTDNNADNNAPMDSLF